MNTINGEPRFNLADRSICVEKIQVIKMTEMKTGSPDNKWKEAFANTLALPGGFVLSFLGLGVLWIGTPWYYQFGMFFPFMLLSFMVSRWSRLAINNCLSIMYGAAPIGILITQFRDKDDSHLTSILVVLAWLAAILAGYFLGKKS